MAHEHDSDFDDEAEAIGRSASVSRLHPAAPHHDDEADGDTEDGVYVMRRDPSRWERAAVQIRFWFRTAAIIFLCCFVVAWPVGMSLSAYQRTGLFSIEFGLTVPIIAIAIAISALIFIIGQMLYLTFRMMAKAEELEVSAARFTTPEVHAVTNVRSVGKAVRTEISALNGFLDEALVKLASAESLIRQQVQAIDAVGSSMKDNSGELVDSIAQERSKLIDLTETMNAQAEAFAEAIAEKARLGEEASHAADERVSAAEQELEARLSRLEETAEKALSAFEKLAETFEQRRGAVEESGTALDRMTQEAVEKSANVSKTFEDNTEAIAKAQEKLREESERLEDLIRQQRERADKLAVAITEQSEKLAEMPTPVAPPARPAPASTVPDAPPVERPEKPARTPATPDAALRDTSSWAPKKKDSQPAAAAPRKSLGLFGIAAEGDSEDPKASPSPARTKPEPQGDEPHLQHEPLPPSREERQSTAWRDILAAAEEEEDETPPRGAAKLRVQGVTPSERKVEEEKPAAPAATDSDSDIVWRIRQMQSFMVEIETRLYGRPSSEKIARYKNGERNIFAHSLLNRDEREFRERIKAETARNEVFERAVFDFLANFDGLLEPEDEQEDGENLIDDYLGSPLGQIYVLIGSALDYFS